MASIWFDQRKKLLVVPYDLSDESTSAVSVALDLADKPEHVHVLHVIPDMNPSYPGMIWDTVDDLERQEHALAEVKRRLSNIDVGLQVVIRVGDAGHEVVAYAEEVEAGMILIPSHGRTGLSRVLLGSVAERVVRHAHCPVLVLKKG